MDRGTERNFREELALRTQSEVARILNMNRRSVQQTEQRAFEKCQRALKDQPGSKAQESEHVFARYARTMERWEKMALRLEAEGDPASAAEIRVEAETFNIVMTQHEQIAQA
jgi:transcriptional regulator